MFKNDFFSAIFGENETNSEDMDHKCRQSEHTVLYPNEREGRGRIGLAYVDSFRIAVLPCRCGNSGPEGSPLSDVKTQSFGLSESNHYHNSANTNIINCQDNIRHLHSGRGHKCPEFCSRQQEQQCDCSSTMKSCYGYFKELTIRCLKVADINQYFLYRVSEKRTSVSQQKLIGAIMFFYKQLNIIQHQLYNGINRCEHILIFRHSSAIIIPEKETGLMSIQGQSDHNCIKRSLIYSHVTSAYKSSVPNPLDSLDDS